MSFFRNIIIIILYFGSFQGKEDKNEVRVKLYVHLYALVDIDIGIIY